VVTQTSFGNSMSRVRSRTRQYRGTQGFFGSLGLALLKIEDEIENAVGSTAKTLDLDITAALDDAFHRGGDHSFFINSASFLVGNNAASGTFTLFDSYGRFLDVRIPKDAKITAASLILTARVTDSGTGVKTTIQAEDVDNATQVADESDWETRVTGLTAASVSWDDIADWTAEESGPDTTSPDISTVIQEIVDRSGWASGNAINLFWLNNGSDLAVGKKRDAHSASDPPFPPPMLHVEFEVEGFPVLALNRIVDEVVNLVEQINFTVGRIKIEDEQLTIPEQLVKVRDLIRILDEAENLQEGLVASRELVRVLDENENITEGIIKTKLIAQVEDEVINIVEALATVLGKVKVIDETINLVEGGAVDVQISTSLDDLHHRGDHTFSATGVALNIGKSGGAGTSDWDTVGVFRSITIPKDAEITAAVIIFTARISNGPNDVKVKIQAENVDDATPPTDDTDFHTRSLTSQVVNWDIPEAWVADREYRSPDFSAVIQAIVDRAGWVSGQDIGIWVSDNVSGADTFFRQGFSYDGDTSKALRLLIEHGPGPVVARTLNRIRDEVEDIAEGIVHTSVLLRVLDEVVNVNEGVVPSRVLARILDETGNVVEGVNKTKLITKVEDEVENIVEVLVKLIGTIKITDEAVNLVEQVNKTKKIAKALAEIVNIAEATLAIQALNRILNEAVNINEGVVTAQALTRVLDETENIVEAIVTARDLVRIRDEVINLVEQINEHIGVEGNILKIIDEAVNIIEGLAGIVTLDLQIAAGPDDMHHSGVHAITTSSGNTIVGRIASTPYGTGLRFLNIQVPQGAVITVAFLTFQSNGAESSTLIKTNIHFHDSDNSPQITNDTEWHAIVDSNLTGFVAWDDIPALADDEEFTSPSIIGPLQEVIDRSGWVPGNALHVLWLDDVSNFSHRVRPHAFDGESARSAKLHIEFEVRGGLPVRVLNRILNEPENIVEGLVKARDQVRLLAETVNLQEALIPSRVLVRIQDDTANIVEAINKTIASFKITDEVVNLAEGVVKTKLIAKAIAEVVNIVEVIVKSRVLIRIKNTWIQVVEKLIPNRALLRIEAEIENFVEATPLEFLADQTVGVAIGTPTIEDLALGTSTVKELAAAVPGIRNGALGAVAIRAL